MEDNLLKLDELGHDDPTMIRMMEDMTGVDAKEISLSDPETMSIYTSPAALGLPDDDPIIGKTGSIGVPEFGTPFTRQMLVDTQPKQFDTLIRLSGFSHGTDVWAGNIHDLIVNGVASVNETIGCRDDIMLYLISVGIEPSLAFKTMEAVRKGKVKKSGEFPGDAEQQMRDKGVPEWYIESARKIAYLFPKAHAVAYVMMAFRIAWFKVHEPLAFYAAYFYRRSQKGGFDAGMMCGGADDVRRRINEMHRRPNLTANEEDLLVTMEAVYEHRPVQIPRDQVSDHRRREAPAPVCGDLRPRRDGSLGSHARRRERAEVHLRAGAERRVPQGLPGAYRAAEGPRRPG